MPDITMCKGEGCEVKETCYRFTAKPSEYQQAYFPETPSVNGGCEYYINDNKLNEKYYQSRFNS
jgi:hypothetical protein